MSDIFERETVRAVLSGKIQGGFRHGTVDGHRTMALKTTSARRQCSCCGKRETHIGLGDGLALMGGCEMRVRRWVRDGYTEVGGASS